MFVLAPFSSRLRRYAYDKPVQNLTHNHQGDAAWVSIIRLSVISWLHSFGDDALTTVSLVLLALCAGLAIIGPTISSGEQL